MYTRLTKGESQKKGQKTGKYLVCKVIFNTTSHES